MREPTFQKGKVSWIYCLILLVELAGWGFDEI